MPRSRNTKAKKMKSEENKYWFLVLCCVRLGLDDHTDDEFTKGDVYERDVYKLHGIDSVVGTQANDGPEALFTNILRDVKFGDDNVVHKPEVTKEVEDFPDELIPFADDDVDENDVRVYGIEQDMKQEANPIRRFPEKMNPVVEEDDDTNIIMFFLND